MVRTNFHIGETALHCAAAQNAVKIVDLLIKRGAVINLLDKDGMSALHNAAKNDDDFACVARLIEAGEFSRPSSVTCILIFSTQGRK